MAIKKEYKSLEQHHFRLTRTTEEWNLSESGWQVEILTPATCSKYISLTILGAGGCSLNIFTKLLISVFLNLIFSNFSSSLTMILPSTMINKGCTPESTVIFILSLPNNFKTAPISSNYLWGNNLSRNLQ
jgi:hypothetical protein